MLKISQAVLLIMLIVTQLPAQERNFSGKLNNSRQSKPEQVIFNEIESALSSGNVSKISSYLSSQTYFSLTNGISGYYSSNQAYYVLEDFFKLYQVISFRFNQISADQSSPYGTGVYHFDLRGKKDVAQVYIALKRTGEFWKITQLTIN